MSGQVSLLWHVVPRRKGQRVKQRTEVVITQETFWHPPANTRDEKIPEVGDEIFQDDIEGINTAARGCEDPTSLHRSHLCTGIESELNSS